MEDFFIWLQNLCQTRTRRLVMVMGTIAFVVFVFQAFKLPSRSSFSPLFPAVNFWPSKGTSSRSMNVGNFSLLSDSQNSAYPSVDLKEVETSEVSDMGGEINHDIEVKETNGKSGKYANPDDDIGLDEDEDPGSDLSFDAGNGVILKTDRDPVGGFITGVRVEDPKEGAPLEKVGEASNDTAALDGVNKPGPILVSKQFRSADNKSKFHPPASAPAVSIMDGHAQGKLDENTNNRVTTVDSAISSSGQQSTETFSFSDHQATETLLKNETLVPLQSGLAIPNDNSLSASVPSVKKKKPVMPPISISEMNRPLLRNNASYHSLRPRWASTLDQQILAAKAEIVNSPTVKNDRELYAPVFRNISMFKRSYELMQRKLKIYVYKEGQKPIFHQPLLQGIYASEGWFMKLMEENRHFVAKKPRKAHLFYMPFSSCILRFSLYVPNSHSKTNLRQYLKDYVDMIAAKYPFWNRTGGADHFLVACHDWAPYITTHSMESSIRALCNADLHEGFSLGKEVSLPETNVRSAQNPLKDLGGRPANRRPTLAFFAGNMHGRLRPILLQHWENKDPDMKIFGPMPRGVKSKMTYIQYMKTSKYCICPRGYEVNSPRIVESIFYECIPVIISDNYVPPFFEILNWEAFSVILPEEDVPRLKEILVSIPKEKYLSLQMGVRKVQQHFLWHSKPVKYDLFHMILHSIWFNRVNQITLA